MKEIKLGDQVPYGICKRDEAKFTSTPLWHYILKLPLWDTWDTRFDIFAGGYILDRWTLCFTVNFAKYSHGCEIHLNWGWQR